MKFIFVFSFLITFSFNINANVVSVFPNEPIVLFVERSIVVPGPNYDDAQTFYSPNSSIQIQIDNSKSSEDLVIGEILVSTAYSIDPRLHQHTTDKVYFYNIDQTGAFSRFYYDQLVVKSGTVSKLGGDNGYLMISDMLGLGGLPYFGNPYNAVIGDKFNLAVLGYFVDSKGLPTKAFKEIVSVKFQSF